MKAMKGNKGQTAVEYILMLGMAVSICIVAFDRLNEYLVKNPNSPFFAPLKELQQSLSTDDSGRYKRFPLRLPR